MNICTIYISSILAHFYCTKCKTTPLILNRHQNTMLNRDGIFQDNMKTKYLAENMLHLCGLYSTYHIGVTTTRSGQTCLFVKPTCPSPVYLLDPPPLPVPLYRGEGGRRGRWWHQGGEDAASPSPLTRGEGGLAEEEGGRGGRLLLLLLTALHLPTASPLLLPGGKQHIKGRGSSLPASPSPRPPTKAPPA